MKNNYLMQAWLVLTLSVCFGAALAAVEAALAGKIRANKLNETLGQIPALVPGATGGEKQEIGRREVYRATNASGELVGWVVPAAGQGFADQIELLIGLDAEARTITGLYVLAQTETPGLGNKITQGAWLKQFTDKKTTARLAVCKTDSPGDDEIKAVSGATISSESVTQTVNDSIAELREKLAAARER